ncbi:unnamed protein product, partial [Nesidiocoris tenuis]
RRVSIARNVRSSDLRNILDEGRVKAPRTYKRKVELKGKGSRTLPLQYNRVTNLFFAETLTCLNANAVIQPKTLTSVFLFKYEYISNLAIQ